MRAAATALLLAATAVTALGQEPPEEPTVPPQLQPFEPYLDRTWKGLVDPESGVHDVARWERALSNQAVRMLHSVADGAYGGETVVMWDREREEIVYTYFTTAGFYTSGTMQFDAEGRIHSREAVTGNEDGVTEVRAITELLPDGTMRVSTRMLRGGEWEERGAVLYVEDPDAELILR